MPFPPPDTSPPLASREPARRTVHGRDLVDDYAWLRDPGYPKVEDARILDHLRAENAYAEAAFAPHGDLVEILFSELKGRIKEDESAVPWRRGRWLHDWRFGQGAQYRQWRRKPLAGGDWQVLIDEPALAEGHDYFRLAGWDIDPGERLLARATDTDGSERFTIRVRDLDTGEDLDTRIGNTGGSVLWSAMPGVLLYLELSEEWRPFRLRAHRLGDDPAEDAILYEESDPAFFLSLSRTQSRDWIVLSAGDHVTTEARLFRAADPFASPVLMSERESGVEYSLDHAGVAFHILVNDTHENFRLVRAPEDAPQRENWEEVIPGSDDAYLVDVDAFRDFLAIHERIDGLDQYRIRDHAGNEHRIAFPEESYCVWFGMNEEVAPDRLRLGYQSMVTPPTVFDYDIAKRRLETLKVQEIPSGYDASRYVAHRTMIVVRDGERVPVSFVRRRDVAPGGPMHMTAYGAYGIPTPPHFSTARISLMERGVTVAIAHIRGGDDLGRRWYKAGKGDRRWNTFHDFIDVGRGLVEAGEATAGRISVSGGSAGGQLMGVVANEAPDLWAAVIAQVPFVDCLNTMLDETLPLTPIEWPEWGNPVEDAAAFDYIASYCPYSRVSAQAYPPMLVRAGLNDPRVTYWEPAKWVAKLRATKTDGNLLLLKTEMGAGHGGKSGRFDHLRDVAEDYAFLLLAHGVDASGP